MQIAAMGILFAFESVRMKDMGIGETNIGFILGIGSFVFIYSSIFWARLADRRNCHKALVFAGTIAFAGLLNYFASSETVLEFTIYSIARAITMPMIAGIMPAIAVTAFGKGKRGKKFGTYRAYGSLGFILSTMGLPLLLDDLGMVARVASIILLLSLLLHSRIPPPIHATARRESLRIRDLDPIIKLFLVSFFFIAIAQPAVHGFFAAYARDLGGSTRLIGLLSGFMGFIALVSLPIMGRLIDLANPQRILAISFLAQPLRVFITSQISDANYLWIPLLLHGVCWGGIEVSAIVYLSSLVKEEQKATVISYYTAVRMLGMLAGASMSGYLAERFGYVDMFQSIAAIALFGALLYLFWPTRPRISPSV